MLRAVVEKFPVSKYQLAKGLPLPTSTVYYELERLGREFYVAEEDGVVRPTLKGFVKGVELFGCDVVAPAFGRYLSGLGVVGRGGGAVQVFNGAGPQPRRVERRLSSRGHAPLGEANYLEVCDWVRPRLG
ncbi:hypothetical protein Pcal_0397 [Pyrobaculum calidifontis JCM 11548]|uniref:Uncharacterized protein n=1 Tax=Pyrobaculum calidifontis (strain DSM 21063 / JCM 11548 / VA1) TaxID=410359 RepID=A3MT65_PYRCJ|nr:hypothetical protein Pcal_0397 [Pyrobaculum calidifontis JCM 11548]